MIARTVLYRGSVQGVGFRATTVGVARRFDVAGFVRNLPDGDVEVFVQGDRGEVDRFLEAVDEAMADNIRDRRIDDDSPRDVAGFTIAF